MNIGFIIGLGVETDVIKAVSFLTSFLLVYVMIVTVVVERSQVERLVRVIVALAAVVSCFSVIEYHTGFNVFNHIIVVPVLQYEGDLAPGITRARRAPGVRVGAAPDRAGGFALDAAPTRAVLL